MGGCNEGAGQSLWFPPLETARDNVHTYDNTGAVSDSDIYIVIWKP